jgi:hypothetical protein
MSVRASARESGIGAKMAGLFAAILLLTETGATAQVAAPPFALPQESITVTGTKPTQATINSFIETRTVPTRIANVMARWRRPICPLTAGLADKYAKYVSQRIRDVAAAVGAPVDANPACKPNIEVVFTTVPQDFMNGVRETGPAFLGYHDSNSQADAMAKVTHPIQAWYTTESIDIDGNSQVDSGQCAGSGTVINAFEIAAGPPGESGGGVVPITLNLGCARVMKWSGSRLNNGYDSGLHNVLIVAEPARLFDYEVGSLADYITMLALSQSASPESCQDLPSISNLMAKGCTSAAVKITDGDLAFLSGLYRLPSGYGLTAQQTGIGYQMKKILVTDKGG